jgi:hypothetical protein
MRTAWQEEARREIIARASRVRPDTIPRWGTMSAPRMLAHIADALKMAIGDLRVAPRRGPLRFPPLRHAIIYWIPFPKGAPTAPELLARTATEWDREVAGLQDLLDRFATRKPDDEWPEHPAFGKLTGRDWGALVYKHTDHHLQQFGV